MLKVDSLEELRGKIGSEQQVIFLDIICSDLLGLIKFKQREGILSLAD